MKRILLLLAVLLAFVQPAHAQYSTTLPQAQAAVDGWYRQFLGRAPDPTAGVWVLALVRGQSAASVLADILSSREYFVRAGGTNAGFVAQLYQDQFGRAPTPTELLFWTNLLQRKSRKSVAYLFLVSQGNIAAAPQNQTTQRKGHKDGERRHHKHHD